MAINVNNGENVQPVVSQSTTGVEQNDNNMEVNLEESVKQDPNKIIVDIVDKKTPIIVLYGPSASGKTMTLVRMARFLRGVGYTVEPERSFRPSTDKNYTSLCDNFDEMICSNDKARGTALINFMLVIVRKYGKPVCQILEAPGELYFDPEHPNKDYPSYLNRIKNAQNRKIWSVFLEPNWSDSTVRAQYVNRVGKLKTYMRPQDKIIFVENKIDLTPFVINEGQVNKAEALRDITNRYPNIFVPFENQNPLTRWFAKYNCEFVPFTTGNYVENGDGTTYDESNSIYPKKLWDAWLKLING